MLRKSKIMAGKLEEIKGIFGAGPGPAQTNAQALMSENQLITNLKMSQLVEIQADTFELLEKTFPEPLTPSVVFAPNNSVNTNSPTSIAETKVFNGDSNAEIDATAKPMAVQ